MDVAVIVTTIALALFGALFSCISVSEGVTYGRRRLCFGHAVAALIVSVPVGAICALATGSPLSVLFMVVVLVTAIMVPALIGSYAYSLKAAVYHNYSADACAWAVTNFDHIATEGVTYFTPADIERVLRNPDTTDADRRYLGFINAQIQDIGHEREVYRSYAVVLNFSATETPTTHQIYGVTKNDLETYTARLMQRSDIGGWLPVVAVPLPAFIQRWM